MLLQKKKNAILNFLTQGVARARATLTSVYYKGQKHESNGQGKPKCLRL